MTLLETAQSWLDRGFSVIPIGFKSKRPSFRALRWTGSTTSWKTYKERPATRDELRMWFGPTSPAANLGLVTGFNGLVVIDFDTLDAYGMWLHLAAMAGGMMAAVAQHTYRVMTARGMHIYLRTVEPVESYQVGMIDVKARFGYVLAPPSVHPSGYLYEAAIPTARVMQVEALSDVFPLERPAPIMQAPNASEYTDPFEAAMHAAEVPSGAIEAIKATMRPEDLLGLPRTGRRHIICCPVHNDNHPSFNIYPDGKWKCFGCGAHGDVIDLFAVMHGVSTKEAIVELAEQVGLSI